MGRKVSVTIDRPASAVWNFLMRVENWGQFADFSLKKVDPGWQKGATLLWEHGGTQRIERFVPEKEIQLSDAISAVTYRLAPQEGQATMLEVEFSLKGGQSFVDGGAGQARSVLAGLERLKQRLESEPRERERREDEGARPSEIAGTGIRISPTAFKLRHPRAPFQVAVTPDAKHFVSGCDSKVVKVWEVSSGRLVHSLEGHTENVYGVAVTPDGRHIVSRSADKTAKVWDLSSGHLVHSLEGHTDWVNAVAVTPDGSRVVSGSEEEVFVWEFSSGDLVHSLGRGTEGPGCLEVTSDGNYLVSGDRFSTIRVWEFSSGSLVHKLEADDDVIGIITLETLAVTPDGTHVVSGYSNGDLGIWALGSEDADYWNYHSRHVKAIAVTPDGSRAVSISRDKSVEVLELPSGEWVHSLEGHGGMAHEVVLTPDGKHVVCSCTDCTVRVWELSSGRLVHTQEPLTKSEAALWTLTVTPDGSQVWLVELAM